MADGVDLLTLSIVAIAIVIGVMIVRAVRATNASIAAASRRMNLENEQTVRAVAERLGAPNLPCPRCGGETFALVGSSSRYMCEDCDAEFEGDPHFPDPRR